MNSMISTPADIGKRIFECRKHLGMTQEELADYACTTPQAISNYERGERELKATMIIHIAAALHTSIDFLLTGQKQERIVLPDDLDPEKQQILQSILENCMRLLN